MLADVFKKNERENKTSVYRFPASRGLSRRGKNEKKERKGNASACVIGNASEAGFLLFLPHRERPLLAGK